jgi:tetratricopeptide (TPR) repeat protein
MGIGSTNMVVTSMQSMSMDANLWLINGQNRSPLESPNASLSKLDLKAPGKARHEYDKGYQLLQRKDLQGAVEHLTTATSIYPSYVAAHNALGSAYLSLKQHDQARAEFAQAVALDDHLPASYLNLGCAELALQHYLAAQEAIQKATAIAPLDLQLLTALAYGQLMNHNYAGAVTTAQRVHKDKHDGAAMVHFYAAAAWAAQDKLPEAQRELLTLLREDPKSPAALQAVQIMEDIKRDQNRPPVAAADAGLKVSIIDVPAETPSGPAELPARIRKLMQDAKENGQIAEAEAEAECPNCAAAASPAPPEADVAAGPAVRSNVFSARYGDLTLHASTDEVAVFFAATDHGTSNSTTTASFPRPSPDSAARPSCPSASVSSSTLAHPLRTASSSSRKPPPASCRT